jgi:3-oxoacyl-[acyl-carrier protein] reductase
LGTKAARDSIKAVLAKNWGRARFRVNSINPGLIEGVWSQGFNEGDFGKSVESTPPLGRIGQTDDIAPKAVYLASEDSSYLFPQTPHHLD